MQEPVLTAAVVLLSLEETALLEGLIRVVVRFACVLAMGIVVILQVLLLLKLKLDMVDQMVTVAT